MKRVENRKFNHADKTITYRMMRIGPDGRSYAYGLHLSERECPSRNEIADRLRKARRNFSLFIKTESAARAARNGGRTAP